MNLFQRANVQSANNRYIIRQERIKREGSPYYSYTVGVVAAGDNVVLSPSQYFPESKKYAPLDWAEVVNNDVVDILVTVNGGDTIIVLAGTIRYIEGKPLHELRIKNNDGSTSTTDKKIRLTLQRQPLTMDKWIRRQR